jgi:hypothetical protein
MLKIVPKVCSLLLILLLADCSSTHKNTNDDVKGAVLDKITNAVKNQVLFQEIMLDDPVVKHSLIRTVQMINNEKSSSIDNKIATAALVKSDAVEDKVILAYALHPKYFFWKAKNDPNMNLILSKVDKFVDKLKINISDIKQLESKNDNTANTCSANVSIGQDNVAIEYTVNTENSRMVIGIKDSNDKQPSSHVSQHFSGSVAALCNTWENIKPTTFPPANPQFIVDYDDILSDATNNKNIQLGTIIPLKLMVDGNTLNNELRSYQILQKQHSANNAAK